MSTSRETARDELVDLLMTDLVSALAQAVIGHRPTITDLQGRKALVAVVNAGTLRKRMTMQGDRPTFYFEVQSWVLKTTTGWTVADAEDRLDSIEQQIAATFETNRKGPGSPSEWEILQYDDRSNIVDVEVDGVPYAVEAIPVSTMLVKS